MWVIFPALLWDLGQATSSFCVHFHSYLSVLTILDCKFFRAGIALLCFFTAQCGTSNTDHLAADTLMYLKSPSCVETLAIIEHSSRLVSWKSDFHFIFFTSLPCSYPSLLQAGALAQVPLILPAELLLVRLERVLLLHQP